MTKDIIIEKYKKIIEEGYRVMRSNGYDGKNWETHPSDIDYLRLRTEGLNLLKRSCGENSDHYQELKRIAESANSAYNSYYYHQCLGIIEAAKNDFEGDFLFDIRSKISNEVLGDFLEQAEDLLNGGYYIPAASLIGAILEDTLRKICEKNNIEYIGHSTIDKLNIEIAKAGIYEKLTQKRITALADIRNNADHGNFELFKKDDVNDMLIWVKRFTADYLS